MTHNYLVEAALIGAGGISGIMFSLFLVYASAALAKNTISKVAINGMIAGIWGGLFVLAIVVIQLLLVSAFSFVNTFVQTIGNPLLPVFMALIAGLGLGLVLFIQLMERVGFKNDGESPENGNGIKGRLGILCLVLSTCTGIIINQGMVFGNTLCVVFTLIGTLSLSLIGAIVIAKRNAQLSEAAITTQEMRNRLYSMAIILCMIPMFLFFFEPRLHNMIIVPIVLSFLLVCYYVLSSVIASLFSIGTMKTLGARH